MVVVIDVGATRLRGGLTTDDVPQIDYPTASKSEDIVAQIVRALGGCGRDLSVPVIVGVPGLVTTEGAVTFALYSPLSHIRLQRILNSETGRRVHVINDASLHAVGAAASLGSPPAHIHVSLGTGVGGAVTHRGRLWHGASGFAGEIGHFPVRRAIGSCPCGLVDCLDLVVAGRMLERELGSRWWESISDHSARLEVAGKDVADVVLAAHSLLDLGIVSVSGHLAEYEAFRSGLDDAMARAPRAPAVKILAKSHWSLACTGAKRVASELDNIATGG